MAFVFEMGDILLKVHKSYRWVRFASYSQFAVRYSLNLLFKEGCCE